MHLVAFIDYYTHLYEIVRHQLSYLQLYITYFVLSQARNVWIEYTISLIQIRCYPAVFYGVLPRISPATSLRLKIQLETARFEPCTFQAQSKVLLTELSWLDKNNNIKSFFKIENFQRAILKLALLPNEANNARELGGC